MSYIERSLKSICWKRCLFDSLLALGSTFSLTGFIFLFHLYPQIPDISLAYLLVILAFASKRGLYPALLASVIAFLSFDFFLVPPVYSLLINKFEDILTLIVFLVTAIITSRFASALRERADQANRREQETRILYELVQATNREEDVQMALSTFIQAIVKEFCRWGIKDCVLLLPDALGTMTPQVGVQLNFDRFASLNLEQDAVRQVVQHASTVDLAFDDAYSAPLEYQATDASPGIEMRLNMEAPSRSFIRLVPLKAGQKVVGVLRLLIESDSYSKNLDNSLGRMEKYPTPQALFFSTFLEQAVAVIERGRLQQENVQMKVLQQTDTLRAALLSSVSHDLRTPLSTIKASATSLLAKEIHWDEESRQGFVAAIAHEADRLNSLVENLLDMSRIEAGELHPEKVWYPLDELILDVLDRMQSQFHGRVVQTHIQPGLAPVELDYVLIDQVVTNLLENAIHHTPPGSPIDVSVQLRSDHVQVCIADRGPGISPSEHEHIFDKFHRMLDQAHTYQHRKRSGLGLSICRGLIEAHAGKIWVEQRTGGGACFCFTLPLTSLEGIQLYD